MYENMLTKIINSSVYFVILNKKNDHAITVNKLDQQIQPFTKKNSTYTNTHHHDNCPTHFFKLSKQF